MKKTLVALAALAATGAFAQVSITGLLNAAVTYSSAVAPGASNISAGAQNNNRIAFSATEDLGGGMAAVANAQLRFNPITGNPEGKAGERPLFQGETRVGLKGNFGQVLIGRGFTALQSTLPVVIDPWTAADATAGTVLAPGFNSDYSAGGEARVEGLFYTSPSFGGLTLGVSYSPVTAATGVAPVAPAVPTGYTSNAYSVAANYSAGALNALIGYESNKSSDTLAIVGANYDLGAAKLFAGYGQIKGGTAAQRQTAAAVAYVSDYPGTASALNGGALTSGPIAVGSTNTVWSIGAAIPLGKTTIRAGYSNYGSDIAGTSRDSKLGLGAQYDLSKRTYLFTNVATTTRNNNSNSVLTTTPATNKDTVTAFDLGIQHSF